MQNSSPYWLRLVYKYADDPDGSAARIVARLPPFLSKGASALEIARSIQSKPDAVSAVLKELADHELVKVQASGLNVSFGDSLYSMTAEGIQFFKQMAMQGSRKS